MNGTDPCTLPPLDFLIASVPLSAPSLPAVNVMAKSQLAPPASAVTELHVFRAKSVRSARASLKFERVVPWIATALPTTIGPVVRFVTVTVTGSPYWPFGTSPRASGEGESESTPDPPLRIVKLCTLPFAAA